MLYVKFECMHIDDTAGKIFSAEVLQYEHMRFETEKEYLKWVGPVGNIELPIGMREFPQRIVVVLLDPPCDVLLLAPAGAVYVMNEHGKTIDRV